MAKRKGSGVNKSEEIRNILKANIKMPVREVVSTLAAKGITVNAGLVYFVKNKMKRARRRASRAQAVEVGRKAGIGNPAELVLRVRALAVEAGGLNNLKHLVEVLAE